jgi:hypothetical protein
MSGNRDNVSMPKRAWLWIGSLAESDEQPDEPMSQAEIVAVVLGALILLAILLLGTGVIG